MEKQPLNRIKVMLAERMLTNKQLAEMLGKDPATISKWVTNTSQPTLENLIEILRAANISSSILPSTPRLRSAWWFIRLSMETKPIG